MLPASGSRTAWWWAIAFVASPRASAPASARSPTMKRPASSSNAAAQSTASFSISSSLLPRGRREREPVRRQHAPDVVADALPVLERDIGHKSILKTSEAELHRVELGLQVVEERAPDLALPLLAEGLRGPVPLRRVAPDRDLHLDRDGDLLRVVRLGAGIVERFHLEEREPDQVAAPVLPEVDAPDPVLLEEGPDLALRPVHRDPRVAVRTAHRPPPPPPGQFAGRPPPPLFLL